jgi:hypothetical protein
MAILPLLTTSGRGASGDLVLRCRGTLSSFMPTTWIQDNEEIAARINNKTISFSGSRLLLGKNIEICKNGDDIYFDSDTCSGRSTTEARQYGTFDRILMTLVLTNTTDRIGLTGDFQCGGVQHQ